jgi:two-component system response regulator YesN
MNRVLITDDSPIIRKSITKSVEQFSNTMVVSGAVANGQKAIEWLQSNFADICITDVRMPVINGLELINYINEHCPWMINIVISSYDDFEYAKLAIQLQALDYILKPIDEQQFISCLQKAVEKQAQVRHRDSTQLLIEKLPYFRQWIDRWIEQVQTINLETMPLLIVETVEVFEKWVGSDYYLLNTLANVWLRTLMDELFKNNRDVVLEEGDDLGIGDKTLSLDKVRGYFRLCAVRRLEEGAFLLMGAMKNSRNDQTSRCVVQLKTYIEEHFANKISLQELAVVVDMSKNYMCSVFRQETGMTILNYIVAVRMKMARSLLLNTSLKNYEIANQVGYDNTEYFTELFKKYYSMSPMEFKKRMDKR